MKRSDCRFRDVTVAEDEAAGETILEIEVRGKRGIGHCKKYARRGIAFREIAES